MGPKSRFQAPNDAAVDHSTSESELPAVGVSGRGHRGRDTTLSQSDDAGSVSSSSSDIEAAPTQEDETEKLIIATRETRYVRYLRFSVLLILLSAAALCGTFVYLYTKANETNEFESVYQQYAKLVVDAIHISARKKLEAVASIAEIAQAHAINTNSKWPFVTVPFFEEHVMATKSLTNAFGLALFPIVSYANKREWEAYSLEHRGWINQSYAAQREELGEDLSGMPSSGLWNMTWFDFLWGEGYESPRNPDFSYGIGFPIFRTRDFDGNITPVIDTGVGPFYPQWQAASMSLYYQSTVNSNYGNFDDFRESVRISTDTGNAVIGEPWTDDEAPGYISTIVFPIFDAFHGTSRSVVAFLGVDIFWEDYISHILPSNATGIHVLVESSKGDKFTFTLEGDDAIFVGDGDLHDTRYDAKAVQTRFGQYLHEPAAGSNADYTGPPLYDGFYQYNFTVYPSSTLESQYVSNDPLYYTLGVLGVFLFTSLVFVAYDRIVERRQKIVLSSAQRSDAIVSSLFPATVKNQLYDRKEDESKKRTARDGEDFDDYLSTELGIINPNAKEGPPIAEQYDSATVLFADIAGFTKWSSSRPPQNVFTLLESMYSRFDKKARARGVFKVETIGDCYMACAGLPKPREDHALIMARFARDMLLVFEELQTSLAPALGDEMRSLGLRIGIHSGPVTAGVLRGDRARFQLFGDTVNTASRMESNGLPMQIHVTEETVNLLRDRNKGHWVTARSDKVWAKGKGEMQTYWLTSHSDAHRSRSSGSHESSTYIDMFLSDSPQRKPRNVLRLEAGMASVAAPAVSKLSPPSSPANWRSEAETLNALEAELARRYIRGGGGGGSSSSDGVMPAERAHL